MYFLLCSDGVFAHNFGPPLKLFVFSFLCSRVKLMESLTPTFIQGIAQDSQGRHQKKNLQNFTLGPKEREVGLSKCKLFLGKKFAPRGGVKIYVNISYLPKNLVKLIILLKKKTIYQLIFQTFLVQTSLWGRGGNQQSGLGGREVKGALCQV